MSPVRGCPLCGRAGCNRRCAPPRPRAPRRSYSDTAAYRAMREAVGAGGLLTSISVQPFDPEADEG